MPMHFDDLVAGQTGRYSHDEIRGCIVNCFPIQPSKTYVKLRMLLLKEQMIDGTLGDKVLRCFLYNQYVDVTRTLVRGDILTISDFEVNVNTAFNNSMENTTYHIQVDVISSDGHEPVVNLSKMQAIKFDCLQMISKRYSGVYIVGQVVESGYLKRNPANRLEKKLTLAEFLDTGELGNIKLDCILSNKIAIRNKNIKDGETIRVSGFTVEARPSTSAFDEMVNYYPFQILVHSISDNVNDLEPTVRVVKHANKNHEPELTNRQPTYEYTLLKDLKLEGKDDKKRYHIYGVVVKCRIANSKTNIYVEIVIRDPTLDQFSVYVHNRNLDNPIPDIHPYDIIRFHRVDLEDFRHGLQGNCSSPKDILVFSGSDPNAPPSHISRTYTWTDHDKKTLDYLRAWSRPASAMNGTTDKHPNETEWLSAKRVKHNRTGVLSDASQAPECITIDSGDEGTTPDGVLVTNTVTESLRGTDSEDTDGTNWLDEIEGLNAKLENKSNNQALSDGLTGSAVEMLPEGGKISAEITEAMTNVKLVEQGTPESALKVNEDEVLLAVPTKKPVVNENCQSSLTFRQLQADELLDEQRSLSPADETLKWMPLAISVEKPTKKNRGKASEKKDRVASIQENCAASNNISDVVQSETTSGNTCTLSPSLKACDNLTTEAISELDDENHSNEVETEASHPIEMETDEGTHLEAVQSDQRHLHAIEVDMDIDPLLNFEPQILSEPVTYAPKFLSLPVNSTAQVISIKDIQTLPVQSKNRIQARVVNMAPLPHEIEKNFALQCPSCHYLTKISETENITYIKASTLKIYCCPKCTISEKCLNYMEYKFAFIFRLDDGSGVMNVFLYDKEAEFFFKGVQVRDCCRGDVDALSKVREDLKRILSDKTSRENPLLLDCCLLKMDVPDGVVYHITDTKLL